MKKMDTMHRNIRVSLGIFIVLFTILIAYMGYSVVAYGGRWYATPYNARLRSAISTANGGTIYDAKGIALAWTEGGTRRYNADKDIRRACSHVVGDIYGKSMGAETLFAKYIYGISKNILERLDDILVGRENEGYDITLTIDAELSSYIYENMHGRNGAVVVLNYKTGEILASVSILTFDPATVGSEEPADTSLVDRATMGRYPPGSIMKIVTASAAIEDGVDQTYTCTGEDILDGQKVTCLHAHGTLTLQEAFAVSCNTYFANLSVRLGAKRLLRQAEKFGFNADFNFSDITLYKSTFAVSDSAGDVAWAGIGQYNDLITPMHAAMIAGSIANGGIMMEPKLLKAVDSTYSGFACTPTVYKQVLDSNTAAILKEYMRLVVEEGTGASAAVDGVAVYGKTGTAEYTEEGETKNHSWFIGFTDGDYPYAVAIVFEGAGFGSAYAAPMAAKIFAYLTR